jgi:hypothetical protein
MLGAAVREWRALVTATGSVTDRISSLQAATAAQHPESPSVATPQAAYPIPTSAREPASETGLGRPCNRVEITVARPGPRPTTDPITAIQDRVDHLRRMSWILAESGTAPMPILANFAAIGVLLASATDHAHRLAAEHSDSADELGRPALVRSDAARLLAQRWSALARLMADLRSAHPSMTAIQVERVDLARLLAEVRRRAHNGGAREIADGLWSSLQAYTEVARHLGVALWAAHDRGEVYVRGRALPAHVLPRSSDLLEAKLADRPVPMPAIMLREVESALVDLHGGPAPDRRRPRRRPRGDDHSPAA